MQHRKKEYIKSPLNYTGGKYKLLGPLFKKFPNEFEIFYDLFAGGLNVSLNVQASKIIVNDYDSNLIELYQYFQSKNYEEILKEIQLLIKKYKLSDTSKNGYEYYGCNSSNGVGSYNKEKYLKLRDDYNKKPNPIKFFTLIVYCFNNQIRFNNKGLFNLPVGKRDINNSIKSNLEDFIKRINSLNIELYSADYREIEILPNSFVYLDPPYLASTASYNENGRWTEQKEIELLDYIDLLNKKKINFALSNVFQNKDRSNNVLIKWAKKYNVNYLNHSYSNSNYQAKNRNKKTIEVLITNFGKKNAR